MIKCFLSGKFSCFFTAVLIAALGAGCATKKTNKSAAAADAVPAAQNEYVAGVTSPEEDPPISAENQETISKIQDEAGALAAQLANSPSQDDKDLATAAKAISEASPETVNDFIQSGAQGLIEGSLADQDTAAPLVKDPSTSSGAVLLIVLGSTMGAIGVYEFGKWSMANYKNVKNLDYWKGQADELRTSDGWKNAGKTTAKRLANLSVYALAGYAIYVGASASGKNSSKEEAGTQWLPQAVGITTVALGGTYLLGHVVSFAMGDRWVEPVFGAAPDGSGWKVKMRTNVKRVVQWFDPRGEFTTNQRSTDLNRRNAGFLDYFAWMRNPETKREITYRKIVDNATILKPKQEDYGAETGKTTIVKDYFTDLRKDFTQFHGKAVLKGGLVTAIGAGLLTTALASSSSKTTDSTTASKKASDSEGLKLTGDVTPLDHVKNITTLIANYKMD